MSLKSSCCDASVGTWKQFDIKLEFATEINHCNLRGRVRPCCKQSDHAKKRGTRAELKNFANRKLGEFVQGR